MVVPKHKLHCTLSTGLTQIAMELIVFDYKKSINYSDFSTSQIAVIWDFYVTKSVAASASQRRTASDYGLKQIPFSKMLEVAEIEEGQCRILLADKMPATLKSLNLSIAGEKGIAIPIEVDTPRFSLLMGYSISDEEIPKPKDNCSKAECLLTHIRNAFAHGNTYFFDNGNVLLEDKNKSITTAMILIKQKTLLDWIKLIDHEERFYRIVNAEIESEE